MSDRILGRWHAHGFTSSHIESGPVTWTLDFAALKLPVAQSPSVMRANVIDAKMVVADAKQDNQSFIGFDEQFCAVGKFRNRSDFLKFRHIFDQYYEKWTESEALERSANGLPTFLLLNTLNVLGSFSFDKHRD